MRRPFPLLVALSLLTLAWTQRSSDTAPASAPAASRPASASPASLTAASRPTSSTVDRGSDAKTDRDRNTAVSRMGSSFKQETVGWGLRLRGLLGYGLILLMAYLLSTARGRIRWRTVLWGLGLQAIFALIVLNPMVGDFFFESVDAGVKALLSFAEAGMDFLFAATVPHQVTFINGEGKTVTEIFVGHISPVVKSFAFWILPTLISPPSN